MRIVEDSLNDPQVIALLELHVRQATQNSPVGSVFALDLSGLQDPAVTVWSAWDDSGGDFGVRPALMGLGALLELDPQHGEVKSMRTAPAFLRRGVAATMLDHLTVQAKARGYTRLSLETGGNEAFAPARVLYEAAGFRPCAAFANYVLTDFNRCYSKAL